MHTNLPPDHVIIWTQLSPNQCRRILASGCTHFDWASAILNSNSPETKRVLGSKGEAKRGVSWGGGGRAGRGEGNVLFLRPHSFPAHLSWDNMVANLLDRELIPLTREHIENVCTAGYLTYIGLCYRYSSKPIHGDPETVCGTKTTDRKKLSVMA